MTAMEVVAACALDAAVGDPRIMPHPCGGWAACQATCTVVCTLGMGPCSLRAAGAFLALGLPDDGIHGRLGFDRGWHGSP
jgi:hypothetical protein